MRKWACRWLVGFMFMCMCLPVFAWLSNDPFVLIPESENPQDADNMVELLGEIKNKNGNTFWDEYDTYSKDLEWEKNIWGQFRSGIMNRNTIFWLLVQVVKFIANAALIVGSLTVIYAGYLYTMSVYTGDTAGKAKTAIATAIKGIVIVIFSYAILRIVIFAFL